MLTPSRIIDFLVLHFNLETAIISPPESFLASLTQLLSQVSTSTVMPVRKLSSITSRISHFAPFIHHGRLQLRFLQFWIKRHWTKHRQPWDTPLQLDAESPALVQQTGCSHGSSVTSTGTQPLLFHRRFLHRLGSQFARSSHLRTMVSTGFQSAHQLVRTGSHPSCSPQVGTSLDQSDSPSLLRQQYGSSSYKQAGRNPFQVAFQQNTGNLSSSGQVWNSTHPNSSSRNITADALSRLNSPSPTEWRLPQETLPRLFSALAPPPPPP